MKLNFISTSNSDYNLIRFELMDQLSANDLKSLCPPDPIRENFAHKGVVLSGRGPIWLYCFLTHFYHPTKFVATYDPRLKGAVVVESHGSDYRVGDVIPIDSSLVI